MKTYLISAFFIASISFTGFSQNLVPNGSFEQFTSCPYAGGDIDSALFWFNPTIGGYQGSPDYFNVCATNNFWQVPTNFYGYQQAHSGDAYAGILLLHLNPINSREFIEVPLTNLLLAGETYQFEMYANLCNVSRLTTDDIQVYFSDSAVTNFPTYAPLPFTPQISNITGNILDTTNWTLISGSFVAQGGEAYMIIGNFKNNDSTSTTNVNATGQPYAYCYIDDVSLTGLVGINETNNLKVSVYPNPFCEVLHLSLSNNTQTEIILYDIYGRIVHQEEFTNALTINTKKFENGNYMYKIRQDDNIIKTGKIIKQ